MNGETARTGSELPEILIALKKVLRTKGIRYRDLAKATSRSESTIKRYLSGGGAVSIQMLERFCQMAGVRLSELTVLASQGHGGRPQRLREDQEQALADDLFLAFIFLLVRFNWSVSRIRSEYGVDEPRIISALTRLDRAGLIELLPGNRYRLLVAPTYEANRDAGLVRGINRWLKSELLKLDVEDPKTPWVREIVWITPDQVVQLMGLMDAFIHDVRKTTRGTHRHPVEDASWFGVFAAVQPLAVFVPPDDWRGRMDNARVRKSD